MLPPLPSATFVAQLPNHAGKYAFLEVRALSSDGRFVMTRHGDAIVPHMTGDGTISVWDREHDSVTPVLSFEVKSRDTTILSPDGAALCFVNGVPEGIEESPDGMIGVVAKSRPVTLFEIPSGRKLLEFKSSAQSFFFGADGKLLAVGDGSLRDAANGTEIKRLPAEMDGYKYRQSLGAFALYVQERPQTADVRLYA